jgi:hypothetical protein
MLRRLVGIVCILALATSAAAQTPDHTEVVRAAKAAAIAAGIDVDASECARFEVTKRAAALLIAEGAGLLEKTSGNRCEDRAVDIVAFPSGRIFDVLGAGEEGPNTPHWMELTPVSPERWRAPFDVVAPAPAPAPEPPATVEDHDAALHRIEAQLEALRADLAALKTAETEEHAHTRAEIAAFREAAKRASNKALEIIPSILSALGLLRR